jgi:hypothetical protein
MIVRLACIVEGHGEVSAVPVLLRRIAAMIGSQIQLSIPHPIRLDRSKARQAGVLEKATQLAATKVGSGGGILIILDADDDCPAALGPALPRRAQAERKDLPIAVVIASREFESWFIAGADSIRGRFLTGAEEIPQNLRGAKEWLKAKLKNGRYSPTVDHASLASAFDLKQARSGSPSFDKLWRELARLVEELGR